MGNYLGGDGTGAGCPPGEIPIARRGAGLYYLDGYGDGANYGDGDGFGIGQNYGLSTQSGNGQSGSAWPATWAGAWD